MHDLQHCEPLGPAMAKRQIEGGAPERAILGRAVLVGHDGDLGHVIRLNRLAIGVVQVIERVGDHADLDPLATHIHRVAHDIGGVRLVALRIDLIDRHRQHQADEVHVRPRGE